ncbi:MAG TPA: glycosyltransferase family 2 protein [Solirubrobacter sp.]|nr:glycosyltransferase family 2 protein [Solirubrobacter sp.]
MTFAVVVVLHGSRPELSELLPTLPKAQLVVVDTGPGDGGADLARRRGATVIERRDNPGFGAACNLALEHVTQDVTILLNPDTIDGNGALRRLAARAQQPGLHAPRLLNANGSVQRSAHPLPGTLGAFLPAVVHPPLLPRALRVRAEPHRHNVPHTVGWAVAACLAATTRTLRQLGPFDSRIHLFGEDMDLCLRAREQGIRTILHPDLAIFHTGRHSVPDEPFDALARARRDVVLRRRGRRALALDDAAQALTFATRALVKRPNDRERAQLKALLGSRDRAGAP